MNKTILICLLFTISLNLISSKTNFDALEQIFLENIKILPSTQKLAKKFLSSNPSNDSDDKFLNLTDYSLNALFFMAQRAFHLDINAKNDTENPLPIAVDTKSLNLLVDELNRYTNNLNMSLRIFEDATHHAVPKIITDDDGSSLSLQIGMEFGVYDNENSTEATVVLSIDLPVSLKMQIDTRNNKLSVVISSISVGDIGFNVDKLEVDRAKLKLSMGNFFKVAVEGLKEKLLNIDVLAKINELTGDNFQRIDVFTDYGLILLHLGRKA